MRPRLSSVLKALTSGELREMLPQQYLRILHEAAEAATTQQRGLARALARAAHLASRLLGARRPRQGTGGGDIVLNTMALMDIVYRGPEYRALIDALDDEGRETLALYVVGLACVIGLRGICAEAESDLMKWCKRLEYARKRLRVLKRLGIRHSSGRPLMLVGINDDVGPPRILSDSINILAESMATITPARLRSLVGNARKVAMLDVGAYNGETTMRYAAVFEKIGVRYTIYAIEPEPIAYRVLRFNARVLGYPVKAFNIFLGRSEGSELLVPRGPSSSMSQLAGSSGVVSIPVRPAHMLARQALDETGADHIHVRIDTEGAEEEILSSLLGVLGGVKGFSLEVAAYHRLGDLLRFYGMLEGLASRFTLSWASCDFRDLMLVAYRRAS